ncbi:hypothetical protein, partial [Ottowia sp.]|uniref:hypothetical protein n=1 Tax=Ottowia sp. TaxID=1898956 RepID=UPI002635EDA0
RQQGAEHGGEGDVLGVHDLVSFSMQRSHSMDKASWGSESVSGLARARRGAVWFGRRACQQHREAYFAPGKGFKKAATMNNTVS